MTQTGLEIERLVRELGTNAGLISFLVFGFSVSGRSVAHAHHTEGTRHRTWPVLVLVQGLMFGLCAVLVMMVPLTLADGVSFDTRQVVLGLAGAFLPAPAALLAMAMALGYRWHLGGAGVWVGMASVLVVTVLGMLWRSQRARWRGERVGLLRTAVSLFGLGMALAFGSYLLAHALPDAARTLTLPRMAPLVFTVFPLATLIFGLLMDSMVRLGERERALRRAAEKDAQAASVFRNSREGIAILDGNHLILDVNPSFCAMMGYGRDELIGQHTDIMRSGRHDADYAASLARRLQTDNRWEGEMWRRRKDGEVFLVQVSISVVRHADGSVKQQVVVASDLTEARRHEEELARASSYDPLTGLPNRRLFTQKLQAAMVDASTRGTRVAVCCLDLDAFKSVNERHGQPVGDALLVRMAERLRSDLRDADLLARLGGDEFVLALTGFVDPQDALRHIEHLLWRVKEPLQADGPHPPLHVSASVGVTFFPDDRTDADALLRHADQAMYAAKDLGRDRLHVFDASRDELLQVRRETLKRIEQAITEGEMLLHYQPKIRLSDGGIVGAEALVRWQHPERGLLAPGAFLDQILGTPVARCLDDWVMATALSQTAAWQRQGLSMPVSVNLTVSTLVAPDFLEGLSGLLARHPELPRHTLELELLETETMNDLSLVAYCIQALDKQGVRVSIDDFGTGYSSLSYLQRLPAQIIKIDQSFVRDMLDNPRDRALVQGIVGLARAFGRDAVAEGVESAAHAVLLGDMGCDILQGYGVARPMPADALRDWAAQWALPDDFKSAKAPSSRWA